jgi:hypothetical protein
MKQDTQSARRDFANALAEFRHEVIENPDFLEGEKKWH